MKLFVRYMVGVICVLPLFIISAFAYSVEFYNQDGSETYFVGECDDYIYFYELTSGYGVGVELEYDGGLPSFEVETAEECLGFSLTPNSDTAEYGLNSTFSSADVDVEPVMFYLVTVGDGGGSVTPDPDPTGRTFIPLAAPVGWDYYGEYSSFAYFDSDLVGSDQGYGRDWPASYPSDSFAILTPSSGYDTVRSGVTVNMRENLRDVWFTVLVRAAWYPSGDLPASYDITRNVPDIIVTAPTSASSSQMFDINALENTVRMSTSIDIENQVVYFDYDVSFYLPSSVPTNSYSAGPEVRMVHSAELENLGYTSSNGYYRLISVYANIADSDTTADRVYQEYSAMSSAKLENAEGVKQDLQSLNKPDVSTIVPDVNIYLEDVDETVRAEYTDTLRVVFEFDLIRNMLMVCLTMCFASYVLFGKKG